MSVFNRESSRLDEMGEQAIRHQPECLVPGCGGWYRQFTGASRKGAGRGYCPKHYRALLRYGSPFGAAHAGREALIESALSYAAEERGAAEALADAAWRAWRTRPETGGGRALRREVGDADALARMLREAQRLGDFDTSEEADEEFEACVGNLMAAADTYARSLAVFRP